MGHLNAGGHRVRLAAAEATSETAVGCTRKHAGSLQLTVAAEDRGEGRRGLKRHSILTEILYSTLNFSVLFTKDHYVCLDSMLICVLLMSPWPNG